MKKRFCCFMAVLLCLSLCTAPALADYSVADDTVWAYTPIYDESQGQITNLHLACAAIDGWVIGCGETFSFNEAVGERSKEAGYRVALNGRLRRRCDGRVRRDVGRGSARGAAVKRNERCKTDGGDASWLHGFLLTGRAGRPGSHFQKRPFHAAPRGRDGG